jgi:hypothetical protein
MSKKPCDLNRFKLQKRQIPLGVSDAREAILHEIELYSLGRERMTGKPELPEMHHESVLPHLELTGMERLLHILQIAPFHQHLLQLQWGKGLSWIKRNRRRENPGGNTPSTGFKALFDFYIQVGIKADPQKYAQEAQEPENLKPERPLLESAPLWLISNVSQHSDRL